MAFKRLNAEHYIAIKWLAQPKRGGLTMDEVAKEVGVARSTLYEWKKDPLFERELKREIVRQTHDRLPELFESMIDHAIKDGNAAMAKLVVQVNDMLTDKVEVTQGEGGHNVDREALQERLRKLKGEDK
ncbi:MAG: phBC6A51 family helix-turn-helix protein [Bacillota bacterium]